MKNTMIALTLGTFCFLGANAAYAQPTSAEEIVKAQAQAFSEADVFYNIDTDTNYKSAAFSDADEEGTAKVFKWFCRPVYRTYYWRPIYYRPVYVYHRYYCIPYHVHCTWTTITIYKGNDNNGAMLDTNPATGTPLAAQGLRKGDIITHIDGQPLRNLQDLNRATANSRLTVHKGNNVKFGGNLLKNADEEFMKNFEGLQEVEAGTLLTKAEITAGNYDMYKFLDRNAGPAFGVKAAENNGTGVKVTEVVANLPGQKAGFEVGDVILEINGTKIANEQGYSDAIDRAGQTARMKVLCGRTNQTIDTDVILNK